MPAFALEANLFFSSKGGKPLSAEDGNIGAMSASGPVPVDREDPAQLAKMDVSASVLIEATTTCKNNRLTQGLKARVTYALQTQVIYPYFELRNANGTHITQMYQMCAETFPPVPLSIEDPKPKVTKPANALEPGQSPAPGQTKPDVGKGAPLEPPTPRPGFRAYRNRILAQQAKGKKSQTAVKQFPGSRKLLQASFSSGSSSGSGRGSGSYLDWYDDSSWMYDEPLTDDEMANMYVYQEMRTTYCLKVLKQGVQWKTGVVPIEFADSKSLDDFEMEQEIPGTSC